MRRICDDKATSNCLAFGIHRNPPRLIARLAADRRLPLKTAGYYSELLPDRFGNQLTQIERETRWLTFGTYGTKGICLGDADCQTARDEKSDCRAGATAGRHHAPHLD
jgi:hypothetical protein